MIKFEDRNHHLHHRRHRKMAKSVHAYVRGSTVKFYEWLAQSPAQVPQGPAVWICGDCHVGNLGPLADAKGRVAVQIRDLDQTVIGNPAHDIIRLGLSLAAAARSSDLSGVVTAKILEGLIAGYEGALAGDPSDGPNGSNKPKIIQKLLARALHRRWRHLALERIRTRRPVLEGPHFWAITPDEREALELLVASKKVRHMLTEITRRKNNVRIAISDAAYWVKGCSSLGRLRYAVLVEFGKRGSDGYCLLDIKEATPPAAPRYEDHPVPKNDAERVVTGARALSPNLGERMMCSTMLGRKVVLRELMPQDLKLEIGRFNEAEAVRLAEHLGYVVGCAHGRQLSLQQREAWLEELGRRRPKTLDAPSWLWRSVVELIGIHEAEYLEHCRRIIAARAPEERSAA
ncbi:MAG: DUF2252 family protein [Candidatus Binataceae bacterium]